MYKQILVDEKLKFGKRGQRTELAGLSPLRSKVPHWIVVPSKENKNKMKTKKRWKKKKRMRRKKIYFFFTLRQK